MWHFRLEYLSFNTLDHLSLLLSLSSFELKLICIYIAFPVSAFIHSKSPSPYSHLTSYGLAHLSGSSTQNIFQIALKLYYHSRCSNTSGEIITFSNFWYDGTGDKLLMFSALWVSSSIPSRHTIPSLQLLWWQFLFSQLPTLSTAAPLNTSSLWSLYPSLKSLPVQQYCVVASDDTMGGHH